MAETTLKMEKRFCGSCGQTTFHNQSGKTKDKFRCSYCGHPVSTNPLKREHDEFVRKKQVAKLGRLV